MQIVFFRLVSVAFHSGSQCHGCVRSKFEEGCLATTVTLKNFSNKKTFFKIQSEKVVDCGASLQESSVKNLGSALSNCRKKSYLGLSDLVKCFSQTAMSNRGLLKGDVVSARRACCAPLQVRLCSGGDADTTKQKTKVQNF